MFHLICFKFEAKEVKPIIITVLHSLTHSKIKAKMFDAHTLKKPSYMLNYVMTQILTLMNGTNP